MRFRDHVRYLAVLATNLGPGRSEAYRHFFFGAARRTIPAIAIDDEGMRFYLETSDHLMTRDSFLRGTYELDAMRTAIELIQAEGGVSLRGRGFIDVGANVGTTTVPAMVKFGAARAVAIEPSARNIRQLRINLIANDVDDRVRVLRAAVSDVPGVLQLELNALHNYGDNRIRIGDTSDGGEWQEHTWETETVPSVTLDEAAAGLEDPAVLWVDTQGHEGHVLASGKSLGPIPTVIEYWPYAQERAGGIALLHETILSRWGRILDLRRSQNAHLPVEVPFSPQGLADLAGIYSGPREYTDLVLLPG